MAAIFLAPFYILFNLYVIRWIYLWSGACWAPFQTSQLLVIWIGIYLIFSTSLLTGFLIKKPSFLHRFFKISGNLFLGIFLYILLIIFAADTGRLIFKYGLRLSWTSTKESFVLTGALCFLAIILLCVYGILHASIIKVKKYNINISKTVPDIDTLKIVLIADCHFGFCTKLSHAKKIVKKINEQNADLVCIAGDIFDNEYDAVSHPEKIQSALKEIKSRCGVYACWGNHDLNEPILAGFTFHQDSGNLEDPRMEEFLRNSGICLLKDEVKLIDNRFYLIGREDPGRSEKLRTKRKTPAQLTKKLDRGKPVIILDHQPKELKELADAGADLHLCGHTHDGQIFPGNLFTRLFWENSCGYLKKGSMHNIVTSGTGVWGPAMRIGTDSEICVIHVSFKKSDSAP